MTYNFKKSIQCIRWLLPILFFIMSIPSTFGQNSEGINFQAIARDHSNTPANNRKVYVQSTIVQSSVTGKVVFGENHISKTDEFGVFNILIGKGLRFIGVNDLLAIDWSNGPFFLNLKIAITPTAPTTDWDYTKEWVDLGTVQFGVVPYALQALSLANSPSGSSILNAKLNVADTLTMLKPYLKNMVKTDSIQRTLSSLIHLKDSNFTFVTPFQLALKTFDTSSLSNRVDAKLNSTDTTLMLSNRITRDTSFLSLRIDEKESLAHKITDIALVVNYNDINFPTTKAVKDYVDGISASGGVSPANAITLGLIKLAGDLTGTANLPLIADGVVAANKIQDAAVTDAKIASGINKSKVGLDNVTNDAQIYSLNTLTAQVQTFGLPDFNGLSPNWNSTGTVHTLNIPMASSTGVTAGLITKSEFDHFTNAYDNAINSLTTIGNNGQATLVNHVLNIPSTTLTGLTGTVLPNSILAGPITGTSTVPVFRVLVSNDIPNNGANTSGNAATAFALAQSRNINGVAFDGTADINLTAATSSPITFSNLGDGAAVGQSFNGAIAKTISYNSIGAAPNNGSSSITTLGAISTGEWKGTIIGNNYGGAGSTNGILKANGLGIVSAAVSGTDYMAPFNSQTSKQFFAAPNTGDGQPTFRSILASDIPLLNQNTSGNAASASVLQNARLINGVSFNGSADIIIAAAISNGLTFNATGTGASSPVDFDGTVAKTISYNSIGAAPSIGSTNITTLGTIATGVWAGSVIGANYGGAGTNNGLLKGNGVGVVSAAVAGTDFQAPISVSAPVIKTGNTISINASSGAGDGYLSSSDWILFNNKLNASEKGALSGVASLDANGKIPSSQIPAISFSSGTVVGSEAAMLAISGAVVGSIAIRTDNSQNFVLSALPSTVVTNWIQLAMPASIQSINSKTGNSVLLTTDDIGEGASNLYATNSRIHNAFSAVAPIIYTASSGQFNLTQANTNTDGYISSADWNTFNNKMGGFGSQSANTVYAAPNGTVGNPVFRNLVVADIPTLNQNTTGTASNITSSSNSSILSLSNLNSVGTITTGAWNGTLISGQYGGTGVANTGKTITLGGNVDFAGAFTTIGANAISFTTSAATSVSLPTTGILSTLNGTEALTNKSVNGVRPASLITGFTLLGGSTNAKTLTVSGDATIAGTNTGDQTIVLSGDLTGTGNTTITTSLANSGVTAGTYGTGNAVPVFTVDVKGRITNVTATSIAGVSPIGSSLTSGNLILGNASNIATSVSISGDLTLTNAGVTSIGALKVTNSMLSGSIAASKLVSTDISTLGTITTGTWNANVIGSSYGGAGSVNGILKSNGSGLVSAALSGTDYESPLSFSSPLVRNTNTITLPAATTSSNGYITSSDWNLFNGKQSTLLAGTGISITGGNTIAIGQVVTTISSPTFAGATLSGLNVAGVVANSATGLLSSIPTSGSGNIVRVTSPTLVTPVLGDATATSMTASTITSNGDIAAKRYKLTMAANITATATTTIDLSLGNVFTVNMGLNVTTLTLTNPVVGTYLLKFVQDATGVRDVTFPVAWKWAGGVIPNLTNTANKLDIVTLVYDGTTYFATIVQNF